MKKILMTFMLCLSVLFANAQIAVEKSKALDNISIGIEGGVSTPLSFNSMFPLNSIAGIKLAKEITPVIGAEVEGQLFFNENNFQRWTKTFVKGSNVGVNGVINLSNAFGGYKGVPRKFELKTNTGIGILYRWYNNWDKALTAKTALDFNFNLGKKRAHSLVLTPGVYWVIADNNQIGFNKNRAQLAIFGSYVYHFKNSNGLHFFKTYDVGAMNNEISYLYDELDRVKKHPKVVVKELVRERIVSDTVYVPTQSEWFIQFAKNSSLLTNDAKTILDKVEGSVNIVATSSPEGDGNYNQVLSERRAAAVADYLIKKGVKVVSYQGEGSTNESSNRIAIISKAE